jgi:tetratricopeptide (TPR) repeat protein
MATTVSDGAARPAPPEPAAAPVSAAPPRPAPLRLKRRKPLFGRGARPEVDEESTTVHEDGALVRARLLCARGRYSEAQFILETVLEEDPDNLAGRKLLMKACVGLRQPWEAAVQADAVIGLLVRAEQDAAVCEVYVRLVRTKLDMPWKQGTLVAVALAGTRAAKSGVVIDAANRLLKLFPKCRALPSILLAAAERQTAKGRKDLARKTLKHIIARYPDHVEAMRAQQHLERMPSLRATR